MFFNAFIIALREIRRNLTRAVLTVLGVVIGVAAVITMVTLGRGTTELVKSQITNLGSNLLTVRPGQGWSGSQGAPLFSKGDITAIQNQIRGLKGVAPLVRATVPAYFEENTRTSDIQGTTPDYFEIANWKASKGRFFDESDIREGLAVCVIGETIRKELFGEVDPIGKKLVARNTALIVVGVTAPKGQSSFSDDLDDNIIVPVDILLGRIDGQPTNQNISQLMLSSEDNYPTAGIIVDVTSLLRQRRGLRGIQENNFSVSDTRQIAEAVSASTAVMTSLLGAVAGVSLLVGGIGIMNIMLVSVTERTREIGIRLAIGARAREVLLQFLVEAVTLSCVGGITGIALAYGLCVLLAKVVGAPFLFDPKINLIAFIFSAAIGILFGFMPARRAAALDPIDALRHE